MTDSEIEFGATDLGGPKNASPSQTVSPDTDLKNEIIRRKKFSTYFAASTLAVMTLAAIGCLVFSLYVGCHFLREMDKATDRKHRAEDAALAAKNASEVKSPAEAVTPEKKVAGKPVTTTATPAAVVVAENPYLQFFAPLIPASFSSALAVILFITIARFVTNFERMGGEGKEREQTEDYGAIATLVQEIGKLIQNLRGKG
ncbi:hypothetical protein [Pseudomonas koreensis]|uniref:hypothetical protein n=1 Tax=Pseudomonas koreensis TaxID=198620 RepID=UPI0037FBA5B2